MRLAGSARRPFFIALALITGALVFAGHVFTAGPLGPSPGWLELSLSDLVKHSSALMAFALAYRLSYRLHAPGANLATVAVCSSWGALCEICQYFIPARDFAVMELGVNMLAPALVALAFAAIARIFR